MSANDVTVQVRRPDPGPPMPGERALVGARLAVAPPGGHTGLVHHRSGLAARCGVTVLNAPGTVDSGYRGEIRVNLVQSTGSMNMAATGHGKNGE